MASYTSHTLDETKKIATDWLGQIGEIYKNAGEALVVGLSGHLGAGKTSFVKAVAEILGVKEEVTSPTFVLMKIYATKNERWKQLIHIDAYRLSKKEELSVLKLEQLTADPRNLIMIEWPEQVQYENFTKLTHLSFEANERVHTIQMV